MRVPKKFVSALRSFCIDLLSRKFLLTVGFGVALLLREQYTEVLGLLVAYLGIQGAGDFMDSRSSGD